MTLETILNSIRLWNEVRKEDSSKALEILFDQGNGFSFAVTGLEASLRESDETVHAYAGVHEGLLKYFIIDSKFDTKEQNDSPEGILPYISVCDVKYYPFPDNTAGDTITYRQASDLVSNWEEYKTEWLKQRVRIPDGIYQAFDIPYDDVVFQVGDTAFFGLKNDRVDEKLYTADLVIVSQGPDGESLFNYSDLVRPVPPFKFGDLSRQKFFLLELALD